MNLAKRSKSLMRLSSSQECNLEKIFLFPYCMTGSRGRPSSQNALLLGYEVDPQNLNLPSKGQSGNKSAACFFSPQIRRAQGQHNSSLRCSSQQIFMRSAKCFMAFLTHFSSAYIPGAFPMPNDLPLLIKGSTDYSPFISWRTLQRGKQFSFTCNFMLSALSIGLTPFGLIFPQQSQAISWIATISEAEMQRIIPRFFWALIFSSLVSFHPARAFGARFGIRFCDFHVRALPFPAHIRRAHCHCALTLKGAGWIIERAQLERSPLAFCRHLQENISNLKEGDERSKSRNLGKLLEAFDALQPAKSR